MSARENGVARVAPVLGVEESDIRYLCHAYFNTDPEGNESVAARGLVAVTANELILIQGTLVRRRKSDISRLLISDIDGAHTSDNQIQLKIGEERPVIWIVKGNRMFDSQGLKGLYKMLVADGVPPWQSEVSYAFEFPRPKERSKLDRSLAPGRGTPGSTAGSTMKKPLN